MPLFERGISLANKTVLLFGGAVVVIVLAALAVPWFRMATLVDSGQLELSRQLVEVWDRLGEGEAEASEAEGATRATGPEPRFSRGAEARAGIVARKLSIEEARASAENEAFVREALGEFERDPSLEETQRARWVKTTREYRYARAVRGVADGRPTLLGVTILERRSVEATKLLLVNTAFLVSAGGVVLMLSLAVFYFITHKLILSPVRALKETTERVREGNLDIRSDIKTGDEFEELAETFNQLLTDMQARQDQLRANSAALDLKIDELQARNETLAETAKLKGEFLAKISHELRTPLNAIIGFAELMQEIAKADALKETSPTILKRLRYIENILTAGRNLMALINSLLEMAKIEAGKVRLHVETMAPRDVCEGLVGLIQPIAEKKGIQLKLEVGDDVPMIRTDTKKFQQIIFNFLSNAVKFTEPVEQTGRPPLVTLRVERLVAADAKNPAAADRVRVSVIDNGPGIAPEEHARIFEKFHQLDNSHTREHTGTGLGLSISKELAGILHGEIQLVSEPGRGSMFSLILPTTLDEAPVAESEMESRFRGALAGRREFE